MVNTVHSYLLFSVYFSLAVTEDLLTVYNGHLSPILDTLDLNEQVSIKTSGIAKNTIALNSSRGTLSPAAVGTTYESENNGTYSTVDRTYGDYDNYGAISST